MQNHLLGPVCAAAVLAFTIPSATAEVIHFGPNDGPYPVVSNPANLVFNGDFNLDPLVDPNNPFATNPTITGWTVTPQTQFPGTRNSNAGVGADGRGLSLGEFEQLTDVSQTLSTVAGASYRLSFFYTNDYEPDNLFRVLVGNALLANLDGVTPTVGQAWFSEYLYNFTATGTQTELTFQYQSPTGFQYLSNVAVLPVPLPASLPLLGAAILALLVGPVAFGRRGIWRAATPTRAGAGHSSAELPPRVSWLNP